MPSQFDEDQIIAEALAQESGIYVDVGGYHPIHHSNTHALYEKGWWGVVIDPMDFGPMYKDLRPRDTFIAQAAGDKKEVKTIHFCQELTSFDPAWFRLVPQHRLDELSPNLKGPRRVQVDTLMGLLEPYPEVIEGCLFCSIDVEGYEKEVLMGIDFEVFHPPLMVLEAATFLLHEPLHDRWEYLLFDAGYSYLKANENGTNRFYWRES
jgi:hypothetical protein